MKMRGTRIELGPCTWQAHIIPLNHSRIILNKLIIKLFININYDMPYISYTRYPGIYYTSLLSMPKSLIVSLLQTKVSPSITLLTKHSSFS